MTIRGVLMWYLGAIIVVGGSGAAGYTAIKQHRALLAEQSATTQVAEQAPAPSPAAPAETAAVQAPAVTPVPHPSPAAATKTAAAPVGRPWPALPKAEALAEATPVATDAAQVPTVPSWALEAPVPRPSRSPRRPVIAHNSSSGKHASHVVVASLHRPVERPNPPHRPAVYAAAHAPAAPRVTYYAYPGYYPYQSGYPYYSYYSRYSRYPYYSTY
ncbi:MAG TPA: hypothetical protein VGM42_03335 [Rhodopila sp.]|jgi:hypothetical protein